MQPARLTAALVLALPPAAAPEPVGRPLTDLTADCETALALSALPGRLRADASVLVLDGARYRRQVEGGGAFTCIVERNHPGSIAPQCLDRAGADSILETLIVDSERALADPAARRGGGHAHEAADEGSGRPAARSGISYMMSDYNYVYVESAGVIRKVPPHVMYYAPYLTDDDIGGSLKHATRNIGTPFIFNEGMHGYMISYTLYASDSDDVARACRGQLGEPPPRFEPFRDD